jgi:uncharacterized iron-regulated membrane protein
MTTNSDRLTYAVLALAIVLLIAALIGLIVWADTQINRWQGKATELEAELADTRAELLMWQGEMKGPVEGETNFEPRISEED